jgi:O-antigen/teichoic acid export membrane protein
MRSASVRFAPVLLRAGWGLGDQALSSLTNFALGVLIARTVGVEQFGAFSLAFAAYLLLLSISRSYPMEPLPIRYSSAPEASFREGVAASVGSVLAISLGSSVVLAVIGLITGGAVSQALIALAITLPGLLVQDAWRSVFFAWRRGRSAFFNDLLWAIIMFPALLPVIESGDHSVFWPTFVWGASATVAALFGVFQSRVIPQPLRTRDWWREHIDLGPRFITEVIARTAGSQLSTYGIGLAAGLAAVGALRAAQLILGPIQVVFLGIGLIAVPEGVRALGHSLERLRRLAMIMSAAIVAVSLLWGAFALLVPESVGSAILGSAWAPARAVLVPVIIGQAGAVATVGPGMGLRALAAAATSLRVNAIVSVLLVSFGVGGAVIGDTSGAAWGTAVACLIAAVIWWRAFVVELRRQAIIRAPGAASTAVLPRDAASALRENPDQVLERPSADAASSGGS